MTEPAVGATCTSRDSSRSASHELEIGPDSSLRQHGEPRPISTYLDSSRPISTKIQNLSLLQPQSTTVNRTQSAFAPGESIKTP
jgi:hypothetical protein